MGYLKDFRVSFAKRLEGLDPEAMKETLNVACEALLESYRNGQKSVEQAAPTKRGQERAHRVGRRRRA